MYYYCRLTTVRRGKARTGFVIEPIKFSTLFENHVIFMRSFHFPWKTRSAHAAFLGTGNKCLVSPPIKTHSAVRRNTRYRPTVSWAGGRPLGTEPPALYPRAVTMPSVPPALVHIHFLYVSPSLSFSVRHTCPRWRPGKQRSALPRKIA